jgi:hypothetical protein
MKRVVSITLLLLFTFNLGGYYFLFWALQSRADQQLSRQLDENSNNVGAAFEIKIPVTLPYPIQQNDFERRDGEFVYKNEHFRLVKQKLENDTLTIVCVKNNKARQLHQMMEEFSAKTSGEQNDSPLLSGKVLLEYELTDHISLIKAIGWMRALDYVKFPNPRYFISLSFPSPPPRG